MKTGIELMADERQIKQIEKHGFTAEHHAKHPEWYDKGQLVFGATLLSLKDDDPLRKELLYPENWDKEWFLDLMMKPYMRRLIIAGSFLAAELDRCIYLETTPANTPQPTQEQINKIEVNLDNRPFLNWQALKEFCNGLPAEFLQHDVTILHEDTTIRLEEVGYYDTDLYIHNDNDDDGFPAFDLKELQGDEDFNINDYYLQPKGWPFLSTQWNENETPVKAPEKQQCYKGNGECDCPGLCRENC